MKFFVVCIPFFGKFVVPNKQFFHIVPFLCEIQRFYKEKWFRLIIFSI